MTYVTKNDQEAQEVFPFRRRYHYDINNAAEV